MNNIPKVLVCIPTYNEIGSIEKIILKILSMAEGIEILIIDDNSPDKTGEKVEEMMASNLKIHLIKRPGKMGLGTAYVEGFKYAIKNNFNLVFEMDADFSHNPEAIPSFLETIKDNDLVIGSRYSNGINVVYWPMKRLLLSYFANVYTKVITGMKIHDATGGYKCYRIEVLKSIDLEQIKSNGYSFQIEMTFKAWKKGFRIKEIPIIFRDRLSGTSKMNKKIVYEAIFMVWKLRFRSMFNRL
jgi:dolichol-phosphate mannosyltransferase